MAINAAILGTHRGTDIEEYWKRVAATKIGVGPRQLIGTFRAMGQGLNGVGAQTTYGSGTNTVVAGGLGLSNAATANSGRLHEIATVVANIGCAQFIPTSATGKFWIGARMAFTTAVGANMKGGIGGRSGATTSNANNTDEFMLGVKGSVSTTNYVFYGAAGTAIDSGVAIDTATHNFQAWRDGTTTYVQVDSSTPVAGDARPNADCTCGPYLFDVDNTQRTLAVYWVSFYTTET